MSEKIKIETMEQMSQYLDMLQGIYEKLADPDLLSEKELDWSRSVLVALLEFVVLNHHSLDPKLLQKLLLLLGKLLGKIKHKSKTAEEDKEKEWEELSENEKQIRMRLLIYEIYKILNPRQIAGETALENFINNVQTRGVEVALQYASDETLHKFAKLGLGIEDLEEDRRSFVEKLKETGNKGFGRGL